MDIFEGFGIEVKIGKPADFLVIKETLTRIGTATDKILYQSCYILHKQGRYSIIHYQELNAFDGKDVMPTTDEISCRNKIVSLLAEWELIIILQPEKIIDQASIGNIKILNFKEKNEWKLESPYRFFEKKRLHN